MIFLLKHNYIDMPSYGRFRGEGQHKIVCTKNFLLAVLPFCVSEFQYQEGEVLHVPSNQVLGGNYRYYPDTAVPESAIETLDYLDSKASDHGHNEQARYIKIGDFPIYMAEEGKNRVDLYRKFNRSIKAFVTQTKCPKISELKLVKLIPFNCFAIEYSGDLRGEYVSKYQLIQKEKDNFLVLLPFFESVKLFEELGVLWRKPVICLTAPLRKRICRMTVEHSFYCK
jgi:hypothetical protein